MNDETQQAAEQAAGGDGPVAGTPPVSEDRVKNDDYDRKVPRDVPEGGVDYEANKIEDEKPDLATHGEPVGDTEPVGEDKEVDTVGFGADEAVQIIRDLSSGAVSREYGRKWLEDRGL